MKQYSKKHESAIALNSHIAKIKKRGGNYEVYGNTISYSFPVEKENIKDAPKLKVNKISYRIQNQDKTFLNAGTGEDSWFDLETARKLVNHSKGQRIIESDGVHVLWEVL